MRGPQPRAEHGFSARVTIRADGSETSLVYDAGLTSGSRSGATFVGERTPPTRAQTFRVDAHP